VVTGAAGGYGSAVVAALRRHGCAVLAVARDPSRAGTGEAEPSMAPVHSVQADITTTEYRARLVEALHGTAWTAVDLVVNAAGVVRFGTELSVARPEDVLHSVDVHCVGALRTVEAVLPWLRRGTGATIVNVTSRHGSLAMAVSGGVPGVPVSYAYRIAKAAQNMLTACLHQELAPRIRVLAVHPGQLSTGIAPTDADRTPTQAAADLLAMLESTPHDVSGVFLTAPGRVIPW